jgi:hypothetical protein
MNVTPAPLVASLSRTEPGAGHSLEARIRHAELRLMEREARLRSHLLPLQLRLQHALRPRPWLWWVLPAVGGAGAVLVVKRLWRWWRRSPSAHSPPPPSPQPQQAAHGVPWLRLLSFAWPLLRGLQAARPRHPEHADAQPGPDASA